jgi:hypothetical protein
MRVEHICNHFRIFGARNTKDANRIGEEMDEQTRMMLFSALAAVAGVANWNVMHSRYKFLSGSATNGGLLPNVCGPLI